jgi:predicted nuclease of restriction endonuclease-like RecB superfamily
MLTRELAIADYDRGRIFPDRLTRQTHRHYGQYAERMLAVYRQGTGRTRRELHRALAAIFAAEEDCPARRIEAFCKLLDDASVYQRDRRGRAAALRREVFRLAAPQHPLVRCADRFFEREEFAVKRDIAEKLGRPWPEIDDALFSDVIDFHRLGEFRGYADGPALLARYNVAQVQAALFGAVSMTVWASEDFKTIVRYAKLARLMHTISRVGPQSYCFRFDGPASVLRETRRYGAAMARFLPALVACRQWRMHAVVQTRRRGWTVALDLSAADGLNSHLPAPEEFDSQVEAAFAEKWGPDAQAGWHLLREGEILCRGQKVFVPDFVLRHDDGRTVPLEIVGFWTPEYLQAKIETLRAFPDRRILLAAAAPGRDALEKFPATIIPYKTSLSVKDVLERLASD